MRRIAAILTMFLSCGLVASCAPHQEPPKAVAQPVPNCVGPSDDGDSLCHVSLIALLGNPRDYDGKRVQTEGYVHFEFEGDAVYLHKEDFAHGLITNSLWISLKDGVDKGACQDSYAFLEGRFRAGFRGHMGMFPGELAEVGRCDREPPRKGVE